MTALVRNERTFARREAWLNQLRAACLAIEGNSSPIRSVSVSDRFAGVEAEERKELLEMASDLAAEHSLTCETLDRGVSVTVWISRQPAQSLPRLELVTSEPEARRGFLGRFLSLSPLGRRNRRGACPACIKGPDGTTVFEPREGSFLK